MSGVVTTAELQRRERRMMGWVAGSVALNMLLSVALVAAVMHRPQPLLQPTSEGVGGAASAGAAAAGLSRSGRKLQCGVPACGVCPGDSWCQNNMANLQILAINAQQWFAKIVPTATGIQINGDLTIVGGVEVLNGGLKVTSGSINIVTGDLNGGTGASRVTANSLEVTTTARIGTNYQANAFSSPVMFVYGDAWYGQAVSAGTTSYLTRVRPGKVITSWPDVTPSNSFIRAETSIGRKQGDDASLPQLSVFGTSQLGTKWTRDADTAGKVCSIYGDAWVGQDTSGGTVHLTRIRPGKVSNSWPRRDGRSGTEEASIGKRAAQPFTDFQLSVFGSVSLANGTTKFTV